MILAGDPVHETTMARRARGNRRAAGCDSGTSSGSSAGAGRRRRGGQCVSRTPSRSRSPSIPSCPFRGAPTRSGRPALRQQQRRHIACRVRRGKAATFARGWLALHHRLPWLLMSFLADVHRRGVLRQAGAIYQFRHIELQRRLATRTNCKWPRPRASCNDRSRYTPRQSAFPQDEHVTHDASAPS